MLGGLKINPKRESKTNEETFKLVSYTVDKVFYPFSKTIISSSGSIDGVLFKLSLGGLHVTEGSSIYLMVP